MTLWLQPVMPDGCDNTMYDDLAACYHLIFEDWDASVARQAAILGPLLETARGKSSLRILDAACGIGTQAIGLAMRGHTVTGSDLSEAAVARARVETAARNLAVPLHAADLRDLSAVPGGPFDALVIADNAFAHLLCEDDVRQAALSAASKLNRGGVLLATLRDYEVLARERPAFQGPAFYVDGGRRRIVHQVWDWTGERHYTMHLYITREIAAGWEAQHFSSAFHAVPRAVITGALEEAGFTAVSWMEPGESGYYQPVVLARLGNITTARGSHCKDPP